MELGSGSQSQQAQIIEILSVLDAKELSVFFLLETCVWDDNVFNVIDGKL